MRLAVIQPTNRPACGGGSGRPARRGKPLPIATLRAEFARAWADHVAGEPMPRGKRRAVLTPPGSNAKLSKGRVPIYGLSLAPADASGYEVCAWRTVDCTRACLGITAGRSRFGNVQRARIVKTRRMVKRPYAFMRWMLAELEAAQRKHGGRFALRLNVLSDLEWGSLAPFLFEFGRWRYDYTKSAARALRAARDGGSYRLVLSHSGFNLSDCREVLAAGGTVATVFRVAKGERLPAVWEGAPVIDGDRTDARWRDARGVVVGLRAKGSPAPSPFVVEVAHA
jgi:hypothetical protein